VPTAQSTYDVAILGAGHNGLVAAAYLAQAGLRVLILEKSDHLGGAATSRRIFPDYDARISPFAYLVSLLPATWGCDWFCALAPSPPLRRIAARESTTRCC
jgi:cation diffusion facilitator CzcD-associated flavoprotein CzcO